MTNAVLLSQVQVALSLDEAQVLEAFALGGAPQDSLPAQLDDTLLLAFLDGVVIQRRGPRPGPPPKAQETRNNAVLKKLRAALQLHESTVRETLQAGGRSPSKSELAGIFRAPGHKSYRVCSEELLEAFLAGLTAPRPAEGESSP